jgi:hypothetical protein
MAAKQVRKWEKKELRLVSEYVKENFPSDTVIERCRLGPAPNELIKRYGSAKADKMYRPSMKWADAVVITPTEIILIEGKLRASSAAIGQLIVYRDLIYKTLRFEQYKHLPIRMQLVTPWVDPTIQSSLDDLGIEQVLFYPDWIEGYIREQQKYDTEEYQKRKQIREMLEESD